MALLIALAALVLLGWTTFADALAAADGWRAAFLLLTAPSIGAVVLLLVARVCGADWDAALIPLLKLLPLLALLSVPVVIGQALFHWPAGHLHVWLSPAFFALRSVLALIFWVWLARELAQDRIRNPGPWLLAHGLVISVMGYDWLLGVAPAQPQSAAPMTLALIQIGGAAAFACAVGLGRVEQRRDLAYLVIASGLGLAYLLYIDFAIVWFGNLPAHVGWYAARFDWPIVLVPGAALIVGLIAPILLIGLCRDDIGRARAGGLALVGLGLAAVWLVAGAGGWFGLLAALGAVVAVGGLARGMVA